MVWESRTRPTSWLQKRWQPPCASDYPDSPSLIKQQAKWMKESENEKEGRGGEGTFPGACGQFIYKIQEKKMMMGGVGWAKAPRYAFAFGCPTCFWLDKWAPSHWLSHLDKKNTTDSTSSYFHFKNVSSISEIKIMNVGFLNSLYVLWTLKHFQKQNFKGDTSHNSSCFLAS